MKLGADNCPQCGNLYSFVSGSSIGVACRVDGCEAGFATSNLPSFASDVTDYTCYVELLPDDWMRAVAWLGNRFNIPTVQARNYRSDSSLPLITRKASELFYLRREFDEHGIENRIAPEFNYSDDCIQSDGERPLTEDELQVICELIDIERHTEKPNGEQDAPSNGGQRPSLNSGFPPRRG
jgi:hypothetical protein